MQKNQVSRKNPPRVGMRNIKTTLAVFVCLLFYHLIGLEGYMFAVIATIICMQETIEKSFESGRSRFIGTLIGCIFGTALLILRHYIPVAFAGVLLASLGITLLIALFHALKLSDSIIIACVALITIVMGNNIESPMIYGLNSLLGNFLGITVALVINLIDFKKKKV